MGLKDYYIKRDDRIIASFNKGTSLKCPTCQGKVGMKYSETGKYLPRVHIGCFSCGLVYSPDFIHPYDAATYYYGVR